MKGGVVSRHAQRTIVQFMAANCGRSKKQDDPEEAQPPRPDQCPPNALALQHVHKILDEVGGTDGKNKHSLPSQKQQKPTDSDEDEPGTRIGR